MGLLVLYLLFLYVLYLWFVLSYELFLFYCLCFVDLIVWLWYACIYFVLFVRVIIVLRV